MTLQIGTPLTSSFALLPPRHQTIHPDQSELLEWTTLRTKMKGPIVKTATKQIAAATATATKQIAFSSTEVVMRDLEVPFILHWYVIVVSNSSRCGTVKTKVTIHR
jgi:hypothetical protein